MNKETDTETDTKHTDDVWEIRAQANEQKKKKNSPEFIVIVSVPAQIWCAKHMGRWLSILHQIAQQWWILHIQKWLEAWSSKTVVVVRVVIFSFFIFLFVDRCRLSLVSCVHVIFFYITRHHQHWNKKKTKHNKDDNNNKLQFIYLDDNFRFIIVLHLCHFFLFSSFTFNEKKI